MGKSIKNLIQNHPRGFILLLAFIYVVLAGLIIQLVFLPYIAPQSMNGGDGLLAGYDGPKFHNIALRAAQRIQASGWQVWELLPEGQVVSGIASIFYVLITPKPWVLLPLNGLLHGVACVVLFEILFIIIGNQKLALISTLPFMLFPSSLLWNAQLHNENYAIPGVLLFVYGWILLAKMYQRITLKSTGKAIFFIVVGSLVNWIVRDYIQEILSVVMIVVVLIYLLRALIVLLKRKSKINQFIVYSGVLIIAWMLSYPGTFARIKEVNYGKPLTDNSFSAFDVNVNNSNNKNSISWKESGWLPSFLDMRIKKMANTRAKLIKSWSYAGSQIDTEVSFGSAFDVLKYVPRALQISFLAPFPSEWFKSGYKKASGLMRKESAMEMMFVYVCLLGAIYSLWRFRSRIELWILLLSSVSLMTVYASVIPNVGSLYRFRYVYLMPIVCLGLAGCILLIQKFVKQKDKNLA